MYAPVAATTTYRYKAVQGREPQEKRERHARWGSARRVQGAVTSGHFLAQGCFPVLPRGVPGRAAGIRLVSAVVNHAPFHV